MHSIANFFNSSNAPGENCFKITWNFSDKSCYNLPRTRTKTAEYIETFATVIIVSTNNPLPTTRGIASIFSYIFQSIISFLLSKIIFTIIIYFIIRSFNITKLHSCVVTIISSKMWIEWTLICIIINKNNN